eukprot:jgi/Tetstr1/463368/TSEL_008290.t1
MIRNGVRIPFKSGPPAPFNRGVLKEDATPDQLHFMDDELARFLSSGACWEEGHCLRRFRGCRMLPYTDDFILASNRAQAFTVRDRLISLLGRLGLSRHPDKGQLEPVQRLDHLGLEIDSRSGRAQFLFLAIKPARFYLRELRDVLRTKDSRNGRVKVTRQIRRDLKSWVAVPNHSNGRSIYKPVERACMSTAPAKYGWGAVLNETTKARGFWYERDRDLHISYKELKAVRLTSHSPMLMTELRKLWFILDSNDISIRARYIKIMANI